ncbi:MAG: SUMF1/EgtB/PvdO family nonheme iron enzyme [Candidatus Latescibacteria bacterium]|nr:SUMF1/EgtB/PvdO family nonheme iron enzyme [Candidatus Latescibacterota bacterium]
MGPVSGLTQVVCPHGTHADLMRSAYFSGNALTPYCIWGLLSWTALAPIPLRAQPADAGSMLFIPAGQLWLGEYEGRGIDPVWQVDVHAFYIDKYEVSNAEYQAFVQATDRPTFANAGPWFSDPAQPAVGTWFDGRDYCQWMGKRLPTEAEWERAAEGDDGRRYPWADNTKVDATNWRDGSFGDGAQDGYVFTAPIDSFPQGVSPFGVYNMAGNVWEWVADWYDKEYFEAEPQHLLGPDTGAVRVMRGGAWDTSVNFTRTSRRGQLTPDYWYADVGFRCAADAPPADNPVDGVVPQTRPIPQFTGGFEAVAHQLVQHDRIANFLDGPIYEVGPGVAMADYDQDGDLDLFTTSTTRVNLYSNDSQPGTIALSEVTQATGIQLEGEQFTGAVFADYDNDGAQDLYVGNFFAANHLLRQGLDGRFEETTEAAGIGDQGSTAGMAFADYDNDGDLDLMVANYFKRFLRPESIDNSFFRNDGDGTFTEYADQAGIQRAGHSFQPLFFDYDQDGAIDLYLVNDFGANELYHNRGDGTYEDVSAASGSAERGSGMGGALGDYDGDGDLDIYITNFGVNALLRYDDDGTFTDVAATSRTNDVYVGWGTDFIDYDNDGDLDLYAVNGGMEWNSQLGRYAYAPDIFYLNQGHGVFADITQGLGVGDTWGGRGLAVGDLDRDGFQDMVVINIDQAPQIYRNRGDGGHWLKVRPKGTSSNLDGVGAQVRISAGGRTQYQEVLCGNSYLSQSSMELDFGLGTATQIDWLEVRWPASGKVDRLHDIGVDQIVEIVEGNHPPATAVEESQDGPAAFALEQNTPNPFNAETRIAFQVERAAPVRLDLFNTAGQKIRTLVRQQVPAGYHQTIWDGLDNQARPMPSGVYFYRLETGNQRLTRSLVLLK